VQLPISLEKSLLDDLEDYLEGSDSEPGAEATTAYIIDLLEYFADEHGIDDIIDLLEESGALENALPELLESEMMSNSDFEYTAEETVSLLTRLCEINWVEANPFSDLDDDTEAGHN